MATQNLSRNRRLNQKRNISVFTAMIALSDVATSADVYQLFALPEGSLVTHASAVVVVANDAATSATADLGFEGDAAALLDDADLKAAAGTVHDDATNGILRETGGNVIYTPTYTGTPTVGTVLIRIEYIEYEKITGELTNFIPQA